MLNNTKPACSIEGCVRPRYYSREWCRMHFTRWERHGDPLLVGKTHRTNSADFWAALIRQPSGCWEWAGSFGDVGYGVTSFQGKQCRAHRLAWFFHTGAWSEQLILHRCDNRKCCNPDHLYEGTHQDNADDRVARGVKVGRFYKNAASAAEPR